MDQTISNNDFSYDVFLSYRHKPRDNKICKKAHTLLETFKPPRRHNKSNIKRVFRDDEELPVAGVLSDTIGNALKSARVLLVICSKDTPESQWVDREVRTFIELGRFDKIYALLLEGDPSQCFPNALRLVPGIENRTLRIAARSERQMINNLKRQLLQVVAAATGTPYEPLRIAVRNRKIGRSILAGILLSLFLFASGLYSLYQWTKASYYNIYTQREELLIHDIIHSISFGLTESVQNLPGASAALAKLLSDNNEYLDRILDIGGPSEKVLVDKGNNNLNLAKVYMLQGDADKAKESSRQAVRIFEDLRKTSRDPAMTDKLALASNLSGLFMQSLSEYDEAIIFLNKAAAIYQELNNNHPGKDYLISLADCYSNIAVCYYLKADYSNAADFFIQELRLRRNIFCDKPSLEDRTVLADLTSTVGSCLVNARDFKRAEPYNIEAVKQFETLHKQNTDVSYYKPYVVSLYSLGINQVFLKNDKNAEYNLRLSLVEADKLVKSLPEFDPVYLAMYAIYDLLYAEESKKEEALSLAINAYEVNPSDDFIGRVYSYSLLCNGYFDEALAGMNSLIEQDEKALSQIELDLELFSLRGRTSKDVSRLKESLGIK